MTRDQNRVTTTCIEISLGRWVKTSLRTAYSKQKVSLAFTRLHTNRNSVYRHFNIVSPSVYTFNPFNCLNIIAGLNGQPILLSWTLSERPLIKYLALSLCVQMLEIQLRQSWIVNENKTWYKTISRRRVIAPYKKLRKSEKKDMIFKVQTEINCWQKSSIQV